MASAYLSSLAMIPIASAICKHLPDFIRLRLAVAALLQVQGARVYIANRRAPWMRHDMMATADSGRIESQLTRKLERVFEVGLPSFCLPADIDQ